MSAAVASSVAAAALLAGCRDPSPQSVTVQISVNSACVRTPLTCGGEVGVTLVDGSSDAVLATACAPFAADANLTPDGVPALVAGMTAGFPDLTAGRSVAVEVAIYTPASGLGCPRYLPSAPAAMNPARPSYFGRSAAFALGQPGTLAVSMRCYPSSCVACTHYASPAGDDAAAGTADAPLRTISALLHQTTAGQTACLLDGAYVEDVTFARSGSTAQPITLSAAPGAHVTLNGVLTVPETISNLAIQNLSLDGATTALSAGPLIRGTRIALRGNDITNSGANCVVLGDQAYGTAKQSTVEENRIHGCTNGVVARVAESGLVSNNYIYDNTAEGAALTPYAQSVTVEQNTFDGNAGGVLFGSDGKLVSSNNVVQNNVIADDLDGYAVSASFPGALGTGNVARSNCLWMSSKGDVAAQKGFTASDNITADPMFVDPMNKDFSLAAGSPCSAAGVQR